MDITNLSIDELRALAAKQAAELEAARKASSGEVAISLSAKGGIAISFGDRGWPLTIYGRRARALVAYGGARLQSELEALLASGKVPDKAPAADK